MQNGRSISVLATLLLLLTFSGVLGCGELYVWYRDIRGIPGSGKLPPNPKVPVGQLIFQSNHDIYRVGPSRRVERFAREPKDYFWFVGVSSDGTQLFLCDSSGPPDYRGYLYRVPWNQPSKREVVLDLVGRESVTEAALSPSGRLLAMQVSGRDWIQESVQEGRLLPRSGNSSDGPTEESRLPNGLAILDLDTRNLSTSPAWPRLQSGSSAISWQPDSRSVVFLTRGGTIVRLLLDDSGHDEIGAAECVHLSPDGSQLAYSSPGGSDLRVRNVSTSQERVVWKPSSKFFITEVRWSPDASYVVCLLHRTDVPHSLDGLVIVPVKDGAASWPLGNFGVNAVAWVREP